MIDQLPCVLRENLEKSRQPIELVDVCNIANIPVEDLCHIVVQPRCAASLGGPAQRLGIAASQNECDDFVAECRVFSRYRVLPCKEAIEQASRRGADFRLSEGQKGDCGHPARKRIGDHRHSRDVGRTCQKEPAWPFVAVDTFLDRQHHLRRALATAGGGGDWQPAGCQSVLATRITCRKPGPCAPRT